MNLDSLTRQRDSMFGHLEHRITNLWHFNIKKHILVYCSYFSFLNFKKCFYLYSSKLHMFVVWLLVCWQVGMLECLESVVWCSERPSTGDVANTLYSVTFSLIKLFFLYPVDLANPLLMNHVNLWVDSSLFYFSVLFICRSRNKLVS